MAASSYEYAEFLKLHLGQLLSIDLPEELYETLFQKVFPDQAYDAGESFVFDERNTTGGKHSLCAKQKFMKHGDIFLIDHAWTNDGGSVAKQQLENMPQLLSRMQDIFGIQRFDEDDDEIDYLENDLVVSEICSCSQDEARAVLKNKKGSLLDAVIQLQSGDQPRQQNKEDDISHCTFQEFKQAMFSHTEITESGISDDYMRKMYSNFLKQKGKGIGAAMTLKYNWSDNSADELVEVYISINPNIHKNKVKSKLTINKWKLEIEGMGVILDGELCENVMPDECWWAIESPGVLCMSLKKVSSYGQQWNELIKGEMQLSPDEIEIFAWKNELKKSAEITEILDTMWLYNQTYRLSSPSSNKKQPPPIWYVMDDVGCAISHSATPNFACSPFFLLTKGLALNVMWPIRNIDVGEQITRNFIPTVLANETQSNFETRAAILSSHISKGVYTTVMDNSPIETKGTTGLVPLKIGPAFVKNTVSQGKKIFCDFVSDESLMKVASNFDCKIVKDKNDADLVLSKDFPELEGISSQSKVNHISGEEILLKKDELNRAIREKRDRPSWYPITYDLRTELSQISQDEIHRNNYWMIRGADLSLFDFHPVVTSDQLRISRLVESGAAIASKFSMMGPAYRNKKFALSFTTVVTSLKPLELYVHSAPYIRSAPRKFSSLKILDEYDTSDVLTERPVKELDENVHQDLDELFKSLEECAKKSQLTRKWKDIERDIASSIGELFSILSPSLKPLENRNSFALIGVDFVLDSEMKPIFLGFDQVPVFSSLSSFEDVVGLLLSGNISKGVRHGDKFIHIVH